MAGTPAITTDWGAFSETVEHGKTGFRCRTLNEFVRAVRQAPTLNPHYIHDRAVARYSMEAVKWQYQTYFARARSLSSKSAENSHFRPSHRKYTIHVFLLFPSLIPAIAATPACPPFAHHNLLNLGKMRPKHQTNVFCRNSFPRLYIQT
jgi:hypothetical protein